MKADKKPHQYFEYFPASNKNIGDGVYAGRNSNLRSTRIIYDAYPFIQTDKETKMK